MNNDFLIKINIQYNSIIVIQSLRPNDRPTGEELYNDIISRFTQLNSTTSSFHVVETRLEFLILFQTIADAVKTKNLLPILHLEIHGDDTGMQLTNGEMILWEEIEPYLREINTFLKNKLLITLAACKGITMYKMVKFDLPAPFWGIVAPKSEISSATLIADFTEFYTQLLRHKDIQAAVDCLNVNKSGFTYALLTCEIMLTMLFEIALANGKELPNFNTMCETVLMRDY